MITLLENKGTGRCSSEQEEKILACEIGRLECGIFNFE